MTANVLPLEYASAQSMGRPQLHAAAKTMVWLAVLSGLCVGSCFLVFSETFAGSAVHMLIFTATIGLAVRSGIQLSRAISDIDEPARRLRIGMDLCAGAGLLMITLAPIGIVLEMNDARGALYMAIAFTLLTVSTPRHVMCYRLLASFCREVNRAAMVKSLLALGWFKTFYEFIWLGSCALGLFAAAAKDWLGSVGDGAVIFAVAGLLGCIGFIAVWIWMIICHARFVQLTR